MAERKSGPVKPPVIDLTPRETSPQQAESQQAAPATPEPTPEASPEAPVPEAAEAPPASDVRDEAESSAPSSDALPPRSERPHLETARPERRGAIWPAAGLGAIGGAILGTALTYSLAASGYLPASAAPADPQLDELLGRVSQLEERSEASVTGLSAFNERIRTVETEMRGGLEEVRTSLGAIEPAAPAQPVDVGPIEAQIADLRSRLDAAAAAAPSTADADAVSASVSGLEDRLAGLEQGLAQLTEQVGATDSRIGAISDEVASARSELAEVSQSAQNAVPGPALQLPLILSGLEAALDTGRPFTVELQAIRAALPDKPIPAPMDELARSGLVPPDVLGARFADVLPEMLAATPATPDADWLNATLDWGRNLLALRPTGEVAGNSPQAVVSRIENAMERRDYTAAAPLFGLLPEEMLAGAGDLPQQVAARAAALAFVADLRATALSVAGAEQTP